MLNVTVHSSGWMLVSVAASSIIAALLRSRHIILAWKLSMRGSEMAPFTLPQLQKRIRSVLLASRECRASFSRWEMKNVLCGLVLAATMSATAEVKAQSFDCSKAKTASARLICADSDLGRLDGLLGAAFQNRKSQLPATEEQKFSAEQLAWIKMRNYRCALTGKDGTAIEILAASKPCMVRAIQERIAILNSTRVTADGLSDLESRESATVNAAANPATRESIRQPTAVVPTPISPFVASSAPTPLGPTPQPTKSAQSLQTLCNPADSNYNKADCDRQVEMFKCLTGGQQTVMRQSGYATATDIPPATFAWIEKTCREELVPEAIQKENRQPEPVGNSQERVQVKAPHRNSEAKPEKAGPVAESPQQPSIAAVPAVSSEPSAASGNAPPPEMTDPIAVFDHWKLTRTIDKFTDKITCTIASMDDERVYATNKYISFGGGYGTGGIKGYQIRFDSAPVLTRLPDPIEQEMGAATLNGPLFGRVLNANRIRVQAVPLVGMQLRNYDVNMSGLREALSQWKSIGCSEN